MTERSYRRDCFAYDERQKKEGSPRTRQPLSGLVAIPFRQRIVRPSVFRRDESETGQEQKTSGGGGNQVFRKQAKPGNTLSKAVHHGLTLRRLR
jgi:hypothetical protein